MIERMDEQVKQLTKADRQELNEIEVINKRQYILRLIMIICDSFKTLK